MKNQDSVDFLIKWCNTRNRKEKKKLYKKQNIKRKIKFLNPYNKS